MTKESGNRHNDQSSSEKKDPELFSSSTELFYRLTPDRVLAAVEQFGVRCTGRCLTLNSMENRVYELELDEDGDPAVALSARPFRVAKFYRPGRWSKEQIQAEHTFLSDLVEAEVPVVAPIADSTGETIRESGELGIFVALFPKARGRNPDELTNEQLEWMGRLLARLHIVGAQRAAPSRLTLSGQTYALNNLTLLENLAALPLEVKASYRALATQLATMYDTAAAGVTLHRIHGDCHQGNILWGSEGPFFLDFDDMLIGPAVQDLWLLISGRDEEGRAQLQALLSGYEQMRDFDRRQLKLIEGLRGLRYINYAAWIAKRWEDPIFKRVFPHFGTIGYWQGQLQDLQEQVSLFQSAIESSSSYDSGY